MKIVQGTALLVSLMSGTGLVFTGLPVLASIDAECRQEAKDYGIPSEQLEDYVSGCVMSRGGDYAPDPAVQDYAAPPEGEVGNDTGMDGRVAFQALRCRIAHGDIGPIGHGKTDNDGNRKKHD